MSDSYGCHFSNAHFFGIYIITFQKTCNNFLESLFRYNPVVHMVNLCNVKYEYSI